MRMAVVIDRASVLAPTFDRPITGRASVSASSVARHFIAALRQAVAGLSPSSGSGATVKRVRVRTAAVASCLSRPCHTPRRDQSPAAAFLAVYKRAHLERWAAVVREQGAEPQRLELDRDLRLLQPLRQLARQRRHRVVVPMLGDRRQRQDGALRLCGLVVARGDGERRLRVQRAVGQQLQAVPAQRAHPHCASKAAR